MNDSYVMRLLGFVPAKRSDEFLSKNKMERVECDSCSGEGWTAGGRCGVCGGSGSLFKWIKTPKLTW